MSFHIRFIINHLEEISINMEYRGVKSLKHCCFITISKNNYMSSYCILLNSKYGYIYNFLFPVTTTVHVFFDILVYI